MKLARHTPDGKHYLECPLEYWDLFYQCWSRDETHPAPMPMGHRMFTHPLEYGMVVMEVPDSDLIQSARKMIPPTNSKDGIHRLFGWTENEIKRSKVR